MRVVPINLSFVRSSAWKRRSWIALFIASIIAALVSVFVLSPVFWYLYIEHEFNQALRDPMIATRVPMFMSKRVINRVQVPERFRPAEQDRQIVEISTWYRYRYVLIFKSTGGFDGGIDLYSFHDDFRD